MDQQIINNQQSFAAYQSAKRSSQMIKTVGYIFTTLIFMVGGYLLLFSFFPLFVNLGVTVVVILTAILTIRLTDIPVAEFVMIESQYPETSSRINQKISHTCQVTRTDGQIVHLSQNNKHLAIMGYFQKDDFYTIWMYGKKSFTWQVFEYVYLLR